SGQCKHLRHELSQALAELGPPGTLAARDTERDVGTELTAEGEQARAGLLDVVQANCKRAQEALRTLEEFGKVHGSALAARLEQLRYRSYSLERAILQGAAARARLADVRLYFLLTASQCALGAERTLREAVAGGVGIVQLREKHFTDHE